MRTNLGKWRLLIFVVNILIFSCINYKYNPIREQIVYNNFVNVEENSVLNFQYKKLYYCIPAYDKFVGKQLEYGYGTYDIDYKNKIITVHNEPISRLKIPSRSSWIEIENSHLKNNEFNLTITDGNNHSVDWKSISYGGKIFRNPLKPDSIMINYKLNITPEEKLVSSKIIIQCGSVNSGAGCGGYDNSFDPIIIDISNRMKGDFVIVLNKEPSFAYMNCETKIKFALILKEDGTKQMLVNFEDNPQITLLNIVE